jgi:glycosyltransferase involved in cell wall biosynthesis
MISVLILTLNEEVNLPACLKSVAWSDDIVVLDSHSTDRTVDIAKAAGARVFARPFDNELNQRAYALREIRFAHPWLYNPDADEVTPPDLRDEMQAAVAAAARPEVAYRVRFKTMFMGRWLRYSSLYPTWVMRLFRPDRVRLERQVNLRYVAEGPVGFLQSHFLHYSFNKGMEDWGEKHRRYARFEAREARKVAADGRADWAGLVARGDPVRRRRALKDLSFRMPCRPLLRFVYMYVIRRGFLDGYPGFVYCRLLANYERMIDEEVRRLRRST